MRDVLTRSCSNRILRSARYNRGLARLESLQAYYTLAGRDLEREHVSMMENEGVGLLVWSPLAGGYLTFGRPGR